MGNALEVTKSVIIKYIEDLQNDVIDLTKNTLKGEL